MSDETKGAEFYIYDDYYRIGIVDNDVGPGACDIVYDEFDDKVWNRKACVSCVDFDKIRALAKAVDLMEAWEEGRPLPSEVTVKIEVKS
jgi:hypothetical protein